MYIWHTDPKVERNLSVHERHIDCERIIEDSSTQEFSCSAASGELIMRGTPNLQAPVI